jgi:hypothetical protein
MTPLTSGNDRNAYAWNAFPGSSPTRTQIAVIQKKGAMRMQTAGKHATTSTNTEVQQ